MKLRYPEWADVTPCKITLEGEPQNDGSPSIVLEWEGKVNYSEKAKRVQDSDGRWIQLAGVIHVKGDILADVPYIRGTVDIDGLQTRTIIAISRPRNPDGTINHTRLEVV